MSFLLISRCFTPHIDFVRWASKKAAGSTKNGRDSPGQRLGLKKSGGQSVFAGQIIARQRGSKWRSGPGTYLGRDHTIHAKLDGQLQFTYHPHLKKTWAIVEPFVDAGGLAKITRAAIQRCKIEEQKKSASEARNQVKSKRKALMAEIEAYYEAKQQLQ